MKVQLILAGFACAACGDRPQAAPERLVADSGSVLLVNYVLTQGTSPPALAVLSAIDSEASNQLALVVEDPKWAVRDFLRGLGTSSRRFPVPDGELADTLFGQLIDTSLADAYAPYAWGYIASGNLGTTLAQRFDVCSKDCLAAFRALPGEQLGGHPELFAAKLPEVQRFLSTPLRLANSITVAESLSNDVSPARIARAECGHNSRPMILYTPRIDPKYQPLVFAFVRAHEYAHWAKGHMRCGTLSPRPGTGRPPIDQRELSADCEAGRIVSRDIERGQAIIIIVSNKLAGMPGDGKDGYPSPRARGKSLQKDECDSTISP